MHEFENFRLYNALVAVLDRLAKGQYREEAFTHLNKICSREKVIQSGAHTYLHWGPGFVVSSIIHSRVQYIVRGNSLRRGWIID